MSLRQLPASTAPVASTAEAAWQALCIHPADAPLVHVDHGHRFHTPADIDGRISQSKLGKFVANSKLGKAVTARREARRDAEQFNEFKKRWTSKLRKEDPDITPTELKAKIDEMWNDTCDGDDTSSKPWC